MDRDIDSEYLWDPWKRTDSAERSTQDTCDNNSQQQQHRADAVSEPEETVSHITTLTGRESQAKESFIPPSITFVDRSGTRGKVDKKYHGRGGKSIRRPGGTDVGQERGNYFYQDGKKTFDRPPNLKTILRSGRSSSRDRRATGPVIHNTAARGDQPSIPTQAYTNHPGSAFAEGHALTPGRPSYGSFTDPLEVVTTGMGNLNICAPYDTAPGDGHEHARSAEYHRHLDDTATSRSDKLWTSSWNVPITSVPIIPTPTWNSFRGDVRNNLQLL